MDFSEFYELFNSCVLISNEAILIHNYNLYFNFERLHNFGKTTIKNFCTRKNLRLDIGAMYYTIYVAPCMSWATIEQPKNLVEELTIEVYENEIGRELPVNFSLQ